MLSYRSNACRPASLLLVAAAFSALYASPAAGQTRPRDFDDPIRRDDRRDDRRDIDDRDPPRRRNTDDLYNSLIESERVRRDIRRPEPRGTLPPAGRVIDAPTREMIQARKIVDAISQDADELASLVNEEVRRNPDLRPYLSDVLKLRARVHVVADRAQQQNDHMALVEDLRVIDRDWRILSLRLQQSRGLDRRTYASVDRINQDAKDLASVLDIKPQMNRRELIRQTSSLATDMSNLLEDIQIELARDQQRDQLLATGRRVRQQAYQMADSVEDQRDYQVILDDFKQFEDLWLPFSAALRPFQNRYLDRHVRRVAEAEGSLRDLLWIPHKMDRQRLLYLTDALKRDVDEFFARTPLKLLIDLPDTRLVLPTAHEFYGVCSNFADSVRNDDSEDDVFAAYRYIDSAYRSFSSVFRNVNSQAALQVLRQIDQSIADLREALNMEDNSSGRRGADLAALIDNLAGQLEIDTKRWLDRYRAPFRQQALQDLAAFSTQARRLNESITIGDNPTQQQRDVSLLFDSWRRVYGYISKCDTEDRPRLQSLSTQITPALVELQTLIAP